MSRPTIKDVAALAGVSKTTVSHVINNTRFVGEETRRKVLQAIDELHFRPNAAARSLTTKRTGIIGMLISDSSNPFFGEILRSVEDVLRPKDYALIVCNTAEILEYEAHYLDLLLNQRVDGILAAATSQPWSELSKAEIQHTPIVFVDREFEHLEGYFVGVDNRAGAYLGTRHLIQCGYKKIGILAGLERLSTMRERLSGFCQALQDAGMPVNPDWIIRSNLSVEDGREAIKTLLNLPEKPDAVFINNNLLALGALLELKERNMNCVEEMGIVAFDDHPWAAVSSPPLTVVKQPTKEIGRIAAEMILALVDNQPVPKKRVYLPCELIVRQSCRPLPGEMEHKLMV